MLDSYIYIPSVDLIPYRYMYNLYMDIRSGNYIKLIEILAEAWADRLKVGNSDIKSVGTIRKAKSSIEKIDIRAQDF